MSIRDLEKERSQFAYQRVENAKEELKDKEQNEYKAYCKKIPSMIQTNGLSATTAFMFSKKGTYGFIYNQIDEWLIKKGEKRDEELIDWLIHINTSFKYRKITIEVLAFFNWLRRFADGMIEKKVS